MTEHLNSPRQLKIADFTYELPDDRVAKFPLDQRDASKLLVYKAGTIHETTYSRLADEIPPDHLLVFNNTRVVQARLHFIKSTGGIIEIFCLEPHSKYPDITTAMNQHGSVSWDCLVGGASKWKHGLILEKTIFSENRKEPIHLAAKIEGRNSDDFTIHFSWEPLHFTFAEILQQAGEIPIPPYLHRKTDQSDNIRYQTIYAQEKGSVAAPTAGLHFTDTVFEKLKAKNIGQEFVTLHVGAGTFKPVKAETIEDHDMHAEYIDVTSSTIESLLKNHGKIISVGTTSLRTIESLYWMGVRAFQNPTGTIEELSIHQWDVYENIIDSYIPATTALEHLLDWLRRNNLSRLLTKTQIMIAPGYKPRMIKGIITNFHQPQSTLLLLVAAIIGDDWKKVYQFAMDHNFRFLSYGDGSLLWCNE